MTTQQLKLCPYCGSKVDLKRYNSDGLTTFVCRKGSACLGSGLITACLTKDLDSALAVWNTRANEAILHRAVEALIASRDDLDPSGGLTPTSHRRSPLYKKIDKALVELQALIGDQT